MSGSITSFNDVFFAYPDGKQALRGISFDICRGESVGIVGENGAGKSTLLRLLAGLLIPQKGVIRVGDTPVTKKNLPAVRRRLGFTFQEPDDQLFMTSVYDDVAFGPRNYGLDEKEVEKRVIKALDTVGGLHMMERAPYKLSGGEKRAAAIAAVLSMEPEILVLDEPTASLDPKARRRLIKLLASFSHTKIIATHDLDMVLELCGRIVVLNGGKVACDGAAAVILSDDALLEQCGLERPLSLQGCPVCGSKKP